MPRRLRLRVFPSALEDAERIVSWIREGSPQAASKFADALGESFSELQSWPRLGREVTRHQTAFGEVRVFFITRFRSYAIFYAVEPETILVLSVVHAVAIRSQSAMPRPGKTS